MCKLPGLNVIKKRVKPPVEKDFLGRIFGWMLPAHSGQLKLSKLNLFGAGGRMMRFIMKKKHIDSLEQLMQQAIANDVEMIACTMSMDVMGVQREELLDHVTLGGVASYLERTEEANLNLFISPSSLHFPGVGVRVPCLSRHTTIRRFRRAEPTAINKIEKQRMCCFCFASPYKIKKQTSRWKKRN